MSERKRLNLSLSPRDYDRLTRICEDYDFGGPCELVTALIQLFIKRVKHAEAEREKVIEPSITEEVEEMFSGLADYEPTPSNTHVYIRHRKPKI